MQAELQFKLDDLKELVESAFELGPATVFQAYSHYSEDIKCFGTARELIADIENEMRLGEVVLSYAIHYPEAKGYIEKEHIKLNPKSCEGHTHRFCINGWGLIQLQADIRNAPLIKCRIAVNPESRAQAWASTYPNFRDPAEWDWPIVKKRAGQLIRRLRKITDESHLPH